MDILKNWINKKNAEYFAQQEANRKATVSSYDKDLRLLFAEAINKIPNANGLNEDIDSCCIKVTHDYANYIASVVIPDCNEKHMTPAFQHRFKASLDTVLDNINQQANQEFLSKLHLLSSEEQVAVQDKKPYDCSATYTAYYNNNSYKLLQISLLDVTHKDNHLKVDFTFDYSVASKYHISNIKYDVNTGYYVKF